MIPNEKLKEGLAKLEQKREIPNEKRKKACQLGAKIIVIEMKLKNVYLFLCLANVYADCGHGPT